MQRISGWVKEEAVDGEVAPLGICLGVTEGHAGGSATIHIFGIGAKSGHLELMILFYHQHDSELFADTNGLGEKYLNLVGVRTAGNIIVLRHNFAQFVTHATAD